MFNKKKKTEFEDHFGILGKNRLLSFLKYAGFAVLILFSAGSTLAIVASRNESRSPVASPAPEQTPLASIATPTPTPSCKFTEFTPVAITSAINSYRNENGATSVTENASLSKFAQSQAEVLAPTDKSKLGADTKLPAFYDWQTSKLKKNEQLSLNQYNVVWNWDLRTVCDFVAGFKQNSVVDKTVLDKSYDTVGIGFKDSFIFVAIGSRQTPAQAAEADRQYNAAYQESLNSALATRDTLKKQADDAREVYEETKAKNDASAAEKLREQYAAVILAIAADSVTSHHSSASSSDTGFTTFGGYEKVTSASNSEYGFTTYGYIGEKLSSMSNSDLGFYTCSYVGDRLSSCSGSSNFITFSYIGERISSASSGGTFITFSGYDGLSSASASGDFYTIN